jgi:hypothetical protein
MAASGRKPMGPEPEGPCPARLARRQIQPERGIRLPVERVDKTQPDGLGSLLAIKEVVGDAVIVSGGYLSGHLRRGEFRTYHERAYREPTGERIPH